ncbi:hypothetical protein X798_03917 [Onchocerca flexuosa]|uniref:Uncharacterized protein n=1 Tax=Onchocerca flexuosa TaxID=387005 RepID=A0A238BUH6_9BILA|nr:hypothetical protein X798_03917 [Onchocerca flexuosa]
MKMISMQIISRILLKIFQFICSTFVVYCLYNTGPQWMLALTCLLIPPFEKKMAIEEAVERSWLRVEIAVCFTMAVVFSGFGILLFCGFFKLMDNLYFLLAGLSSILAALLYLINSLVAVRLLRQDAMDIVVNEKAPKQMSCFAKDDPKKIK